MSQPGRALAITALALVSAVGGAAATLVVGKAAGWLDSGETVVIGGADGGSAADAAVQPAVAVPAAGNAFDPAAIYRERSPGVVTIYAVFDEGHPGPQAQGSGFVVSEDGYVLTNSHVITTAGEGDTGAAARAAREVLVEFSDRDRVLAKVVGWDVFSDVGLLKVDPDAHALAPLPLADSRRVVVGQPVAAIGSPFGQTSSLTVGVVSATERSIASLTSGYDLVDVIQTDTPINRGNSGGPLFDAQGRVVGINSQIRSESGVNEGIGFAVPINTAIRSMRQLIASGEVRYAWAGLVTQSVTPSLARRLDLPVDRGAAIQEVIRNGPAARAKLRAGGAPRDVGGVSFRVGGDIVVGIDGQAVESSEDLVRAVSGQLSPGETAEFEVLRAGERIVVSVELGERPLDAPRNP